MDFNKNFLPMPTPPGMRDNDNDDDSPLLGPYHDSLHARCHPKEAHTWQDEEKGCAEMDLLIMEWRAEDIEATLRRFLSEDTVIGMRYNFRETFASEKNKTVESLTFEEKAECWQRWMAWIEKD